MEDGTVVHINKTTIADTDEDGNSFFFHHSVVHNIGGGDQDEVIEEENEIEDEAEELETGVDPGLVSG